MAIMEKKLWTYSGFWGLGDLRRWELRWHGVQVGYRIIAYDLLALSVGPWPGSAGLGLD